MPSTHPLPITHPADPANWPLHIRVEVEWVDSCSNPTWAAVPYHLKNSTISRCRSIGYVVRNDASQVLLAQSMSNDTTNIADTIAIPTPCILSITPILLNAQIPKKKRKTPHKSRKA